MAAQNFGQALADAGATILTFLGGGGAPPPQPQESPNPDLGNGSSSIYPLTEEGGARSVPVAALIVPVLILGLIGVGIYFLIKKLLA